MTAPATGQRHVVQLAARPLIGLLILGILQPVIAITTTVLPWSMGEATWRVRYFTLLLGAAPQVSVALALLVAVAMFSGFRRPVRIVGFVFLVMAVLVAVIALLDLLDSLQVRSIVAQDRMRAFEINAAETVILGAILVPLLFWAGRRALDAGKLDEITEKDRGQRGLVVGDLGKK
ncbi:MAG: hypothetical protein ACREL5_12945 [Gemmatimonadales bacterium]